MNEELQKIERTLKSLGFSQKTFTELSKPDGVYGKSLVTDNNTAFRFDDISNSYYYKVFLCSADALLIMSEGLYLIEFKHIKSMINNEREKEILRLKLFLKMTESFHTLQNCVFINSKVDSSKFEKHFILVTEQTDEPLTITSAAYNRLSRNSEVIVPAGNVYKDSFSKYRQQYKNNSKKVYYDSVEIWADIAFADKISKLK